MYIHIYIFIRAPFGSNHCGAPLIHYLYPGVLVYFACANTHRARDCIYSFALCCVAPL